MKKAPVLYRASPVNPLYQWDFPHDVVEVSADAAVPARCNAAKRCLHRVHVLRLNETLTSVRRIYDYLEN